MLGYDGSFAKTATSAIMRGLQAGAYYTFRLYSRSFNGNSATYSEISEYACTGPTSMGTVSVYNVFKTNVSVSWDPAPLKNGGCKIRGYGVFRDDGAGSLID